MYSGYAELNDLPAEAFLDWQSFATEGDGLPHKGYAEEQYKKGLKIGRDNDLIFISAGGTWGAERNRPNNHSFTTSYEGIGYHACTKDLLHGFLDSGAPVYIYRWGKDPVRIK
jgi:hypothetical protein